MICLKTLLDKSQAGRNGVSNWWRNAGAFDTISLFKNAIGQIASRLVRCKCAVNYNIEACFFSFLLHLVCQRLKAKYYKKFVNLSVKSVALLYRSEFLF